MKVEPSVCKDIKISVNDTYTEISWWDPGDTVLDGHVVCTWGGTKLVRKKDSYPENPKDGEELVDSTKMNEYHNVPYKDTVKSSENYYYRLFPYSALGKFSLNEMNKVVVQQEV